MTKFTSEQLAVFHEYYAILARIKKRCIEQGIDYRADIIQRKKPP